MAEPLRRTLSKLRGRRSQRGAAAGAHPRGGTGAPQGKAQQRPQAGGAPWAQPRSREGGVGIAAPLAGGSQEESGQREPSWPRRGKAARGPADPGSCPAEAAGGTGEGTPGASATPGCSPGDPAPQPASAPARRAPDGEEGDYYDNDTLPWGGCSAAAREEAQGLPPACARPRGRGEGRVAGARESTGRLQHQLQEAYYLLLHAMNDLPPANPACAGGLLLPAASWSSSGEGSPQQQVSATAWPPLLSQGSAAPPGQLAPPGRWGESLGSLPLLLPSGRPAKPPPLRRCLSDSAIRCHPLELARGHLLPGEQPGPAWDGPRLGGRSDAPAAAGRSVSCGEIPSPPQSQRPSGERRLLSASGSEPREAAAEAWVPAPCPGSRPCASQGPFRSAAVSVGKLPKWMCKGRLLPLGMKGRVEAGASSPLRAIGTGAALPAQPGLGEERPATPSVWRGHGSKALAAPSEQSVLLTDLIENIYISSTSERELKILVASEVLEDRPQPDSITVSKKRNWLHQSTLKAPNLEEENICKTMQGNTIHVPKSPSLLPEPKLPQVPPKSPVGQECPVRTYSSINAVHHSTSPSILRNCTLDFSEDNDADDEGEIWYNPIPEDDEPDFPTVHCFTGKNSVNVDSHTTSFKMLPGSDLIKVAGHNKGLPCCSESAGDNQMAQSSEINQADSIHSMEYVQLHKQRFACKTQNGTAIEQNSAVKCCSAGSGIVAANKAETGATEISPPSPNPLKKGGSINWPFPDKIKSPRTVRKLSIKMKKLPELSRKLSVKGTSGSNSSDNPLLKGVCRDASHATSLSSSGNTTAAASRNVISRYHLDSSVSSQHSYKKKSTGSSKSSSKGGYLSDGDSPELITKSGKHGSVSRFGKGKEALPSNNNKTEIDIDAFRHYSFSDQPKCSQYISGLMSVHFYGAEDLKPPRMDSKDVFCAIQVDSVNKARTALLTCRTTFLDMDHTFNIEIENAQHLKLVVFSWEPTPRKNRVCCHGTVALPTLFRVTKTHQLAVKLEPRGLIYVKLTLMEQWENSLDGLVADREPVIFGVDARKVVEKENVGLMVPLLMQKCIVEIEKRGCQVVGLYRLCGSAAVKKELREAFERDSKAVTLCENQYPDINVITGVLKDYLRELPSPLITKQLYETVLDAMVKNPLKMTASGCENDPSDSEHTVALLDCLPDIEKATLKMLLDHLKLVASYHEVNKMTCQNLAVCFGPVLLSQRQETSNHNNRVFTDSEELASALDFKKHIEVLHYLLQLWPVQCSAAKESTYSNMFPGNQSSLNYLRPKKQRPQMLNLSSTEMSGVLRPRPARLDSPSSNRYAGDWSSCGENYFLNPKESLNEADYDDVPSEDTESEEDCSKVDQSDRLIEHPESMSKEHTFQTFLTMQTIDSAVDHRVNLKDLQESIDILIGNLERELNKNKLNITC
ncbi:rho GTPase-activating protein SYDE2 [Emydura macquarii macquarii]|uniref:rho GTPase-activating protein SYDE2 n=1 Tax=Emydura macquarii macquarii TaxID=1129001 RepID=UPI00352B23E9